ncbi:MAG: DoxX family protein [Acidiferrobacteraceae bacterium]
MNTYSASYAALVLRLTLGVMYLAHALLKLVVFTLPGAAHFFGSVGLPGWLAYVVTFAELGGGLLLVTGLGSRWVALALIPDLLGAILWVHGAHGWLFTNAGGGWEYPAVLIALSVAVALLGDGAWALSPAILGRPGLAR